MKVEITHPDKILFPKDHLTKGDLIAYYELVAPRMLPLIKDRPISMKRYPNGIDKEGFFQKNISPYFPKWIKKVSVHREGKPPIDMALCNDVSTLIYLANQACITPHIWLSKKPNLEHPDRMIFDLDPPGKNFALVLEAARDLRAVLEKEFKLKAYVMTTGSKGLHVVVPIKPKHSFDEVRAFARSVGELLAERKSTCYTTNPQKAKRRKKLFIDYLRNGYAQTGVAPYAVRALDGAPVATPLAWRELTSRLTAQSFTINNIKRRLKASDPWQGIDKAAHSLPL
jgi:bifunctional non-homologous end joining protein LigD